ncbi:type IV toxin-antitoxin system AbiEi family antitoxin domain-containing protein [Micropruina sonneratiae]|uniref:type IV toxin-antitoxin system AbiEi family antitoxin domain-containing protein n=1 Tax=Micropruina sonneratiae TaxID=2986940 RepID=UPI002225FEB2|nr:type IV toxin-antitoxin system AbiEi family antitoxin domain-containing protein [Micropruina sp. KQZ13P-5]MCW3156434.1 type IV toxin-antitoxin system AbiEi family antitoxin domain-containing protein [Micropruina sp. KQZ13P-5]
MIPDTLRTLALAQSGVISRSQLLEAGLHRRVVARLLHDGIVHPMTPGVYTLGAADGWRSRAWAGVLLGGQGAVLGLESAAHLHGLQKAPPDEVTVFAPVGRRFRPGWRFIKATRRATGEPPRTGVDQTVLDLCAEADADRIAAILADAISGRRTTAKRLLAQLSDRPALRHRGLLREILCDVTDGAHSALERRFLVDVERAHRLPTAIRQRHVLRSYRSDALYEEYSLLIELDSKLHHSGGAAFTDMIRDNAHALQGITTLRLGWQQVTGGACETARMVGGVLMTRGWEGPIQPCPRCLLVPVEG